MIESGRAGGLPALYLRPLRIILFLFFFLYVFLFFVRVSVWDIDFWWHLSTGRYIVENMRLPEDDPFSYTTAIKDPFDPAPGREQFILKQYWLSQALFYLIYEAGGFLGVKILRAAILTLTAAFIFLGLRRKRMSLPVSYAFAGLFFLKELSYTGERPQLFSFLFVVLIVLCLEEFRAGRPRLLYYLPLLTLMWANMHGGFVMGDFVIGAYMAGETIKYIMGKKTGSGALSPAYLRKLLIFGVAAIFFSLINPNTYQAIPQMLLVEKYFSGVQEMMSPLHFYINRIWPVNYPYIALLFLALVGLIGLGRRDPTASLLVFSLMAFSLKSSRYTIFFAAVGIFFIAPEIDRLMGKLIESLKLGPVFSGAGRYMIFELGSVLLVYYLIIGMVAAGPVFANDIYRRTLPARAAEFIKENNLPGKMFNSYDFGGYLIWALYPERKVFIDPRGLKIGVSQDYVVVMNAMSDGTDFGLEKGEVLWEKTLERYGVNFVVVAFIDYRGDIYPANFALLESPNWVLIYSDYLANVFIRNAEENRPIIARLAKPKEVLYAAIIYSAAWNALGNSVNPYYLLSIGRVFEKSGRLADAKKAYDFALMRDPGNEEAKDGLKRLCGKL